MKKGILLFMIACAALSSAYAQGMIFFEGTWEEALAKAKAEEKPIFVDAYTTWCGPCKMMARSVFPDAKVGEVYNEGFINMQIDMEKPEGAAFQKKYPVSAYPTLFYIDYDGKVLKKVLGAQSVDAFARLGQSVLGSGNRSSSATDAYEKGDRSPEVVLNYIKNLNRAGKSSAKAANDYLRTQKDLTEESNLKIIFEAAREADSRLFDLLIQHKKPIAALFSEAVVHDRIYEACRKTADKAVEMKNQDLLKEAKDKMKQHLPERAKAFSSQMDMKKAAQDKDDKTYFKALEQYAKYASSEPASYLRQVAIYVSRKHGAEPSAMQSAIELARIAAEKTQASEYYLDLAELHLRMGNKKNAAEAANKAKTLAENEGQEERQRVQQFFLKLS